MVTIKSKAEIEKMREACKIAALAQKAIEEAIKPGISTWELDKIAENTMRNHGAIPAEKGYPSGMKGVPAFPGSICASVNDEVIHGIPSKKVILKEEDGVKMEPYEDLQIEVPEDCVGSVIEQLGSRGAIMDNMTNFENQVRLNYVIPSRGLIGFMTDFMTLTKGYGIINHTFKEYRPYQALQIGERKLGVLVSTETGKSSAYALGQLEDRGIMFIEPAVDVYEGMIVGECNRENDLAVNVVKGKQLTNMRAASADKTVVLKRPRPITLEYALDYINSDELVEITPSNIRLRKKILDTEQRKKFDAKK